MKLEHLNEIHEILKQKAERSNSVYRDYKKELEEKYNDEWLKNISKSEREILDEKKREKQHAFEILGDFEAQDWR